MEISLRRVCQCTIYYGYFGYDPKPDCFTCDGKGWYLTELGEQMLEILKDLGLVKDNE